VRNVSYEDELYLVQLVLRELEHGVRLDVGSTRFLDRLQSDIAFLDEALGEYHASLCAGKELPGRVGYLRTLHLLLRDFATLLGSLTHGSSALAKAFAPLGEALAAMQARQSALARSARAELTEASGDRIQDVHGISDEEFRGLLSEPEPEPKE